jgi:hypothetical protein
METEEYEKCFLEFSIDFLRADVTQNANGKLY